MYVFKNALRNITRAKGRTILVFILILVIAISACVALSIKNSADTAKEVSYNSMQITAQISVNRESMMGNRDQMMSGGFDKDAIMQQMSQSLSIEELENFSLASSVYDFYYTSSISLNSETLTPYEITSSFGGGMPNGMPNMMNKNSGDFNIIGYSSHNAMTDFMNGTSVLVEGEVFDIEDNQNTCVISLELAYLNGLEVGDTITLVNPNKADEYIDFTIGGIFQCESSETVLNDIYVSYNSLNSICENSANVAETYINERSGAEISTALVTRPSATYVFENPEQYELFESEVITLGLDTQAYSVSSNDINNFEKSLLPLENLSNFTLIFFLVVLIIGAIILIVFNLFTIRERKYEIGVLAAIGMQKPKVALQFISETLIVTLFAVIVGAGIGATVSQPLGDTLLASQVESIEAENTNLNHNFGGNFGGRPSGGFSQNKPGMPNFSDVDYIDSIATTTDFEVLLQLLGVGLLLSIISSSVGIISILRYEPLKILSERN